jgi:basic membrane protein A and related proteins
VSFAVIDGADPAPPSNVATVTFALDQASYLVGVVAGQASHSRSLGFIGGVDSPGLRAAEKAFTAGVLAVSPSARVAGTFLTQSPDLTGFDSPGRAATAAAGMLSSGIDVVFAVAGGSNSGVFAPVRAVPGAWAIGVDSDQYLTADSRVRGVILTSALKNVNVAVFDVIQAAVKGAPLSGTQVYDLANGGVGYSKSNPAVQPYEAKAEAAAQALIAGSIALPKA